MWDVGLTHAGSGVAGLSSSGIGFNHSGLCLHEDRIFAWRNLKEHLECHTSSMLMTEELVAVMNQKRQRYVVFSYFDLSLVEEEDDLDHHIVSYETYPF
ncbi:hypothetical protein Tco_0191748 [Tanacetum coccineum]